METQSKIKKGYDLKPIEVKQKRRYFVDRDKKIVEYDSPFVVECPFCKCPFFVKSVSED